MKKRLLAVLSVILTFLMLGGTFSFAANVAPVSSDKFTDVDKGEWYFKYVDWITGNNKDGRDQNGRLNNTPVVCMNGTSETTFEPQTNLTRAMFATILARYDKADVDDSKATIFNDVNVDQWYTGSIGWANEKEIVKGYGDSNFGTMDDISRQDLSLMIIRYIRYYEKTHKVTIKTHGGEWNGDITFTDEDQIRQDEETPQAIKDLVNYGILLGYPDGTVKPTQKITRAETAAIIYRLNWILPTPTGGGGGSSTQYEYIVKATILKNGNGTTLKKVYSANDAAVTAGQIANDLITANDRQVKDLMKDFIVGKIKEGELVKTDAGYSVSTGADGTIHVEGVDLVKNFNEECDVFDQKMDAVRAQIKEGSGIEIPETEWGTFKEKFSPRNLFTDAGQDLKVKTADEYYTVLVDATSAAKNLQDAITNIDSKAAATTYEKILDAAEKFGADAEKMKTPVHFDSLYAVLGTTFNEPTELAAKNPEIAKLLASQQPLVDMMPEKKTYAAETVFSAQEDLTTADKVVEAVNARISRDWSNRNDIQSVLQRLQSAYSGIYTVTVTVEKAVKN